MDSERGECTSSSSCCSSTCRSPGWSGDDDARTPSDADTRQLTIFGGGWARRTFSYRCAIDEGRQPARWAQMPSAVPLSRERPPRNVFEGACYLCGSGGHSQNYCPLRRCECCRCFGHGGKVCRRGAQGKRLSHSL